MPRELPPDVRELMLNYHTVAEMYRRTRTILGEIYDDIAFEVASKSWYSAYSAHFRARVQNGNCLQVFKYRWHPSFTPDCPWLHMEYQVDVDRCRVVGRFDIERDATTDQAVRKIADAIVCALRQKTPAFLQGQGWQLDPAGGRQVMLLRKSVNLPTGEGELDASWIRQQGVSIMEDLSNIVETVDTTIDALFPSK